MKKAHLNQVMLIDDNEATNFIHRIIIEKTGLCKSVVDFEKAELALEEIKSNSDIPNLILLDINMPTMSGWEFLQELQESNFKDIEDIKIIMLTTSVNPEDRSKALNIPIVTDYKTKPLNKEMMIEIVNTHFSELDTLKGS